MADIAKRTGISRQAVYLHFASRAELLEATTKHLDAKLQLEARLTPSRLAKTGADRLALYVEFWGNYIPEIYGVAKALLLVVDSDEAAAAAWQDRMAALRDGCRATIDALEEDGCLASEWDRQTAVDTLWTLLSVENWEHLTVTCGWTQAQYVARMKILVARLFIENQV